MSGFYDVIDGFEFERWLKERCLTLPGGQGRVTRWEGSNAGVTRAICSEDRNEDRGRTRWQKAQQAEAEFWQGWRNNVLYQHVSLHEFWADVLEKTGGPLPGGRVLDIGCGPVSVLNFFRSAGMRPIGIDPLADFYAREGLVEVRKGWEPMPMISLPAERLPFEDGAIDHIVCFNVLDHVSNANIVLQEMKRVLAPGGTVRIYVHTFAGWIKRFLFFDRPHTYHWDHREFQRLLSAHGFRIATTLKEKKTFDLPDGLGARLAHFPYLIAGKVAYTSYFQLRKPQAGVREM